MSSPDQVLFLDQMRAAEDALIARGTTVDELMRRAGCGAAEWIRRVAMGRPVTVLCGPGNNGGDGYVIAQTLREGGLPVAVIAPLPPKTDAARNARAAWSGSIEDHAGGTGGVLVDCLFGSGLSRAVAGEHGALLGDLGKRHAITVAVDLPSGVSTDDGALLSEPLRCDLTLALGGWKPAHFLMPAVAYMGERRLVDIGIDEIAEAAEIFPRPSLAPPAADDHKYRRGLVGIVGGPMGGAAMLAAKAALRGGAGYVKLLSDHAPGGGPSALVIDDAPLSQALTDRRWSSLLVGPGLGRDQTARARLTAVLERRVPTVIDADALHLLDEETLEGIDTSQLLLTPHEGELTALCQTFGVGAERKIDRAGALADLTGVTVLAKGPDTILAGSGGRLAFFPAAPSWLSVAGSGDVLAGLAASRLATGADPFAGAGEAAWLHREAARIAGPAFSADDLSCAISMAYARFL